jgi:hypothetical protein
VRPLSNSASVAVTPLDVTVVLSFSSNCFFLSYR